MAAADATLSLLAYADATAGCERCALAATRTQVVFGSGSPTADLMFVGEAPGFHEDKQGVPFVGAAGQLLSKLLAGVGLSRDDVYIANVIKCRPPGNRDPQPGEIEACEAHLFKQIELIRPQVVATLGNFATKLLSGKPDGITRVHGVPQEVTLGGNRVTLYPIFHPAAALYTPRMLEVLEADFSRIPELIGGVVAQPPAPAAAVPVAAPAQAADGNAAPTRPLLDPSLEDAVPRTRPQGRVLGQTRITEVQQFPPKRVFWDRLSQMPAAGRVRPRHVPSSNVGCRSETRLHFLRGVSSVRRGWRLAGHGPPRRVLSSNEGDRSATFFPQTGPQGRVLGSDQGCNSATFVPQGSLPATGLYRLGRWRRSALRPRRPRRLPLGWRPGCGPGMSSLSRGSWGRGRRRLCAGRLGRLGLPSLFRAPRSRSGTAMTAAIPVAHLDLYRLAGSGAEEWGDLEPYFDGTIAFVEWPENGDNWLPQARVTVTLSHVDPTHRRVLIADADDPRL